MGQNYGIISSSGGGGTSDIEIAVSQVIGGTSGEVLVVGGAGELEQSNIKTINTTSLLGSGDVSVQPTLVSGTNIKTINTTSLLGSGDVAVQPTLVSGTNIKTINGSSILGSGNIVITTTTILASQTLLAANWVQGATYYEYTFTNAGILASSFVTFVPQNSSYLEVTLSQMTSYISVSAGSCILYSILPPQNDIIGDIIIQ